MNNEATGATPDSGQKPDKSSGQNLPFFKTKGRPSILSTGDANVLVKALNKLLNLKVEIVPAETDPDGNSVSTGQIIVSGLNAVLELKIGQTGGTSGGDSSGLIAMQVVSWSTSDDFLLAKVYDFDGGATGSNLKVALPWLLRSAQEPAFDHPAICPPYAANDIIIAIPDSDFGTGISGATHLAIQDRNWGDDMNYLDDDCVARHRVFVCGTSTAGTI